MNLDMEMFQQTFFEETADILEAFEGQLLLLDSNPEDPELLNTIFRFAHSIKGGSATFGLNEMAHFTHALETLLDLLRNGKAKVDPGILQLLLASLDHLKGQLAAARGETDSTPNSSVLIFQIEEAIASTGFVEQAWDEDELRAEIAKMLAAQAAESASADEPLPPSEDKTFKYDYTLRFTPGADVLRQGMDPLVLFTRLHEAGTVVSVQCDTSRLPSLNSLDPQVSYLGWTIHLHSDHDREQILDIFEFISDSSEIVLTVAVDAESVEEEPRVTATEAPRTEEPSETSSDIHAKASNPLARTETLAPEIGSPVQPPSLRTRASDKAEVHTLRVSTDKVDKLINLVGELVINQSMVNDVVQQFSMEKLPRLIEAVADMEQACRELQERVMAVRMLPIKHAFGRFPRLVHDLAGAVGKKIELTTSGEDTELDKSVIEAIADPLTHLIRNSIDHGLETPEERVAAGKSETGTIALHAKHDGGSIVIEIVDDGRGLNRDRIHRKAIDRGLLGENEQPSDEVLYNFIFHPGFSTAEKVTDLSGRGVGMDIVRQSVQALGGSISLSSTPGAGARFRVRLPLTMAILEGLSLSVGNEVYILPLTSIVESIRPRQGDIRYLAGHAEVVLVRGEALPILRLYQVFGAKPIFTDPTQSLLVIVENDGRKIALLVDELIGQSQVVIKSLEVNYRKVDGIAGATILGNGSIALILDVPGLIGSLSSGHFGFAAAA